jgi:TatD DNase family protein
MIDTHCHIDLYDAPLDVAIATEEKGIETIAVTYLPSHYQLAKQNLKNFRYVRPALGLHPLAAKDHAREIPLFNKFVKEAKFIGEVGLDFSEAGKSTKSVQEKSFAFVIANIKGTSKFVTVHSRGAEEAVLDALQSGGAGPVVFHWFSGTQKQLARILDAGHCISLNTAMVSSARWCDLIGYVPRSVVLTESDGPFVRLNDSPAYPSNMNIVLRWLARQWRMTIEKASNQVAENYNALITESDA